MKNRIQYFDVAKGIGMLAIILGHLIAVTSENNQWFEALVFTWHVPIFFLISGYFLNQKRSFKESVRKRAKQLLTPYITTCVALIALSPLFAFFYSHTFDGSFQLMRRWFFASLFGSGARTFVWRGVTVQPIGAIWFFLALLIAQSIVLFFIRYRYGLIGIIAIAALGYLTTPYFWLPFSLQAGMFCTLFVYVGYLAKKVNLMEKKINPFVILVGVTAAIWLYVNYKHVGVVQNIYGNNVILNFVIILFTVYLIVLSSKFIENKANFIKKPLLFFGTNSLIILPVHLLDLSLVNWGPIIGVLSRYTPLFFAKLSILVIRITFYIILTLFILKIKSQTDSYQSL